MSKELSRASLPTLTEREAIDYVLSGGHPGNTFAAPMLATSGDVQDFLAAIPPLWTLFRWLTLFWLAEAGYSLPAREFVRFAKMMGKPVFILTDDGRGNFPGLDDVSAESDAAAIGQLVLRNLPALVSRAG